MFIKPTSDVKMLTKLNFEKLNEGMYTSASEVIRESLRIMHGYEALQQKRIAELNDAIGIG